MAVLATSSLEQTRSGTAMATSRMPKLIANGLDVWQQGLRVAGAGRGAFQGKKETPLLQDISQGICHMYGIRPVPPRALNPDRPTFVVRPLNRLC